MHLCYEENWLWTVQGSVKQGLIRRHIDRNSIISINSRFLI